MKVKIHDTVYDSSKQPIMLILSPADKHNIGSMSPNSTKYCVAPNDMPDEAVEAFMLDQSKIYTQDGD